MISRGAPDTASAAQLLAAIDDVYEKGDVSSSGIVLLRWAPLWMYLFGTAKDRLRAVSKIMNWVPIVLCSLLCYVCGNDGVYTIFLGWGKNECRGGGARILFSNLPFSRGSSGRLPKKAPSLTPPPFQGGGGSLGLPIERLSQSF